MRGDRLSRILTINTGSSSVKTAVYHVGGGLGREMAVDVARINSPRATLTARPSSGEQSEDVLGGGIGYEEALDAVLERLRARGLLDGLVGVGHRVVHGGPHYGRPETVTDEHLATLRSLIPIDPMHLPQAIAAIEWCGRRFPHLPEIACFDTAFHRTMPAVATTYPLPAEIRAAGVMRYGFHGLSYEYIVGELARLDPDAARGKVMIAHLGNGCSMAAVRAHKSVDTTMGFTPMGGLVMGTRTGDIDPGVLVYLLQNQLTKADDLTTLLTARSGMLGVSGISGDMAVLLERSETDADARNAVELFCYSARKHLAALYAALGGLHTLVFTGGIGENAAPIRAEICAGLQGIGILIDSRRNARGEDVISKTGAPVTVRVMRTDEEGMIARHVLNVLRSRGADDVHL